MYVLENPVLQRELLVNLRMARAFILLFLYLALLGAVVYFAWPQDTRLDMTANSQSIAQTRRLVDLFFIGQYVLASMMAPSFAAGSITGEKERKTYEMLLASPLRPAAISVASRPQAARAPGSLRLASAGFSEIAAGVPAKRGAGVGWATPSMRWRSVSMRSRTRRVCIRLS